MHQDRFDWIGAILLGSLAILLLYGGLISYQSIDRQILPKLESIPLMIPTQFVPTPATKIEASSSTGTSKPSP